MKQCKQCNKEAAPSRALCLDCINKKTRAEAKEKAKKAKAKKANRDAIKKAANKAKKLISKKSLDILWSKAVKILAGDVCEYCGVANKHVKPNGKIVILNSHHVYTRADLRLRWVIDNGVSLCQFHHTFSTDFSPHLASPDFDEWILAKRGEDWLAGLREKRNNPAKVDRERLRTELLTIIANSEKEV